MKIKDKLDGSGAIIGTIALALEAVGVASGAYHYGPQPLKILGVPLSIILGWIGVALLGYYVSTKKGTLAGIIAAYSIDLILEPLAYYTGLWAWLAPYSTQIYFGSTVGNAVVWVLMIYIGINIFKIRGESL